jgi:hypothetical protein
MFTDLRGDLEIGRLEGMGLGRRRGYTALHSTAQHCTAQPCRASRVDVGGWEMDAGLVGR